MKKLLFGILLVLYLVPIPIIFIFSLEPLDPNGFSNQFIIPVAVVFYFLSLILLLGRTGFIIFNKNPNLKPRIQPYKQDVLVMLRDRIKDIIAK